MAIIDKLFTNYINLKNQYRWHFIKNKKWKDLLLSSSLKYNQVEYNILKNTIIIKEFGLELISEEHDFIVESIDLIRLLTRCCEFSFVKENNQIIALKNNIKHEVQTREDIVILTEYYYRNCYNYFISQEHIVIDIGMNVGFGSLFFANNINTKRLYSYEPLTPTYEQALKNLARNPDLKGKIFTHNFGIGNSDYNTTIKYNYKWKGHIGNRNFTDELKKFNVSDTDYINQDIQIVNINSELEKITKQNEACKIVMKIDCEGAEYEIFESLNFEKYGKHIEIFMIEWHDKGITPIVQKLTKNNYKILNSSFTSSSSGMIYAVK